MPLLTPERPITQVDLLVHPDYHLIGEDEPNSDPAQMKLRKRWDERITELAENKQALLFYFPGIPLSGRMPGDRVEVSFELRIDEAERRIKYERLLKDRFFIFNDWEKHVGKTLFPEFKARGFTYNPQTTKLIAYGEYLHLCVGTWQDETGLVLDIPTQNHTTLADLSVASTISLSSFLYDI